MDEKELLMQATILLPCDFSKDLDEVKAAMWKGVDSVRNELIQKHPHAKVHEMHHTLLNIVLTNWAITGMASHQKDLDRKADYEKVNQKVETLKHEFEEAMNEGYEEAYQMLKDAQGRIEVLKKEKDILIQYVKELRKVIAHYEGKQNAQEE